jgi:hypothetical protein
MKSSDKYTGKWWHTQLAAAEDRHHKFFEDSKESIQIYKARKEMTDTQRRLNVWWYLVNTLLPAYYSSTPKAEVNLRKRVGGMKYQLGAVVLERNTQFAMDEHFDFDLVGYNAALQFLLTGRSILWARYEAEFEEEEVEFALIRGADGRLVNAQGQPFEGDESSLVTSPEGLIIGKMEVEMKDDERAILDCVHYNDFLTSDARNESEIEWVARRAFMSRYEVEEMFGKDVAKDLNFTSYPDALKRERIAETEKYEGKAELYEIWCKESDKVYWLQKKGESSVLQEGEPPVEFEGFWPCSVINQSTDPDSIIPVSDYVHVKDQILEVERITTRLASVVQAIRTNALYDATMGQQVEQLLQGDLKYIPVMNWPSYKGRGGQATGIEYLDIGPYVEAMQTLQAARTAALEQLYETLKVSDLLRGTSAEYKTATANRLENQWSSLGLIVRQNQFAKFVSDGVNKLGTIIASQFSPKVLFEVADIDTLIQPLIQEGDPQQMAMQMESIKAEVLDAIQNEDMRVYRINIATDSMVALDQAQEKSDGLDLLNTCGQFFDQMKVMIEQYPPLSMFAMELMQNMVRRFKGGKELDALFSNALMGIKMIAQQKEQQAAQPPPPDPMMEQVNATREANQMKFQIDQAKLQIDQQESYQKTMAAQAEAQARMQQSQVDVEIAYRKAQLDEYVAQQQLIIEQSKLQMKQRELEVEMMRIQSEAAVKADSTEARREADRIAQLIDVQRLEMENMAIRMKESEKLLEERRLASEQELERVRLSLETRAAMLNKTAVESKESMPPINITIDGKQNGRRKITKVVGTDGTTEYQEEFIKD